VVDLAHKPVVYEPDLILVGPYPPPLGGVSAHVVRLAAGARGHGLSVGIINHFRTRPGDPRILADLRRNPWRYWRVLRRVRARVVHYHHARWSTLLATAWALRRSSARTVVTVHGRGLEVFLSSRVPMVAWLTRRALRSFDELIAVSPEIGQALGPVVGHPVPVLPAYLDGCDDEDGALSPEADAFLRQGPSLVIAAYRLTATPSGRTIYGLETALESFASLGSLHPDLRLVIFLATPARSRRESRRLQELLRRTLDRSLRPRVGIFYGQPLEPALRLAAVYLRPTLTDGDAVSVREALAAGVPVLASDVVTRPATVTALPLDTALWTQEIARILNQGAALHEREIVSRADCLGELLDIYERLGAVSHNAARPVTVT
jgi:glycosyltransferase involved in cell wall biosynthesis